MYLEEFEKGKEYNLKKVTITKEQIYSFAKDYDPLPVHLDEKYAEQTRFKGLIAPGVMCFMLVWAEFIRAGIVGEEMIAGKSTKIEWFAPVYVGDILQGQAVIVDAKKRNHYNGIVTIITNIKNQHGDLVIRDVTEAVVKTVHAK